jgi:hypothetical protein
MRIQAVLVLFVSCAIVAPPEFGHASPAIPSTEHDNEITVALHRIEEIRRVDLVESGGSQFNFTKPGLVLTFHWSLPEGLIVHDVEQPDDVKATDASGRELSAIEPGFQNQRTYVELVKEWDSPPHGFTFRLLPAARSAETFDLEAAIQVVTYTSTRAVTATPGPEWTAIDAVHFPSDEVHIRHSEGGFDGRSAQISVRPGNARSVIEKVYLIDGEQEIESIGYMGSDRETAYSFQHPFRQGQRVRILVRENLQSHTIVLELRDQQLP